tara:strand:- start:131 stop:2251 length:2121 start_codon:yes stop_codon:yes gene_type:complete
MQASNNSKSNRHTTLSAWARESEDGAGVLTITVPPVLQSFDRRVTCVGIDFPFSHRSVEDAANVIHYGEEVRITPSFRTLTIKLVPKQNAKGVGIDVSAILPLAANRIVSVTNIVGSKKVRFVTEFPHGFFSPGVFGKERKCILGSYETILGQGVVPLTLVNSQKGASIIDVAKLSYVDDMTVEVPAEEVRGQSIHFGDNDENTSWFLTPTFPSISSLADALSIAFQNIVSLKHDASAGETRVFAGSAASEYDILSYSGDEMGKSVLGFDGIWGGWETIRVPAGEYNVKQGKESCIANAIQRQLNRFVVEPGKGGFTFRGISGETWRFELPSGNYGHPQKIAFSLCHMMNLTVKGSETNPYLVTFQVNQTGHMGRFIFSLDEGARAEKDGGPATFDILLGDEDGAVDAGMFGFERVDLVGRNVYVSTFDVHVPRKSANTNVYRADVDHISETLLISRVPRKAVDAEIREHKNSLLKCKTVDRMDGSYACHGFKEGEVVNVVSMMHPPDGSTGEEREGFTVSAKRKVLGVVVAAPEDEKAAHASNSCSLFISVPGGIWRGSSGKYVTVSASGAPFSIALFDRSSTNRYFKDSIGSNKLGFTDGVTCGEDGIVRGSGRIDLSRQPVELHLFESTMTKASSTLYNLRGEALLAVLGGAKKHKYHDEAQYGSTTLSSSAPDLKVKVRNADGSSYRLNGSPVLISLMFEEL